jgi:hypothetical protein
VRVGLWRLHRARTPEAHAAFSRAQTLDPSAALAWAGQALVAERVGSNEAPLLWDHAATLAGGAEVRCMPVHADAAYRRVADVRKHYGATGYSHC